MVVGLSLRYLCSLYWLKERSSRKQPNFLGGILQQPTTNNQQQTTKS